MMMHPEHHAFFEMMQQFRSLNLLATLPLPRQDYMVLYAISCLQKEHPDSCTVSMIAKKIADSAASGVPYPAESGKRRLFTAGSLPFRPPEYLCIIDRCRKDCRTGSRPDACYVP